LCKSGFFAKVTDVPFQPVQEGGHYVSTEIVSGNRVSVEKFHNKVSELGLWKYFEMKVFLFKSPNDPSWKVQFLYVRLLKQDINQFEGLTTEHLQFIHAVRKIDELYIILDQVALAKDLSINNISASLELTPNAVRYDSFYRSHPQNEIFGVTDACYKLLKTGNKSIELAENQILLVSEFNGLFDNLPDAVANRLDLQFWNGTYAPFVVFIAPIPIEIARTEINDQNILMILVIYITTTSMHKDILNDIVITGEIKNRGTNTANFVELIATFYNINNQTVGNENTFTKPTILQPGQAAPFTMYLSPKDISLSQIKSVKYHLSWKYAVSSPLPSSSASKTLVPNRSS
jgi:hypothetical protein